MRRNIIRYVSALLLLAAMHSCVYGQYINRLHDYNHTFDWGWCLRLQPDNNLFVVGWSIDQTTNKSLLFDMILNNAGDTVISRHTFQVDQMVIAPGDPGQISALPGGGYIIPLTKQWNNSITSYLYSAGGFVKFNAAGDSVFMKTYTDTSIHFDLFNACSVMPDSGYISGGGHGLNTPSYYPGLIVRTDSTGDTLWTHTYQKYLTSRTEIKTLVPLDNAKILAGASNTYQVIVSSTSTYNRSSPWFMTLDSAGNILKDTTYDIGYAGGGKIYTDMNGGYIHIGLFDSLFTSDAGDNINFPGYVMHLDTNFRPTWVREFNYSIAEGHREPWGIRQLHDSNYIVFGDDWPAEGVSIGWAAKVDKHGNMVWNHTYRTEPDYSQDSYLRDMVELPNGNLVFIGAGFNDSLPSWRQRRDVWLLGVDSNGCEVAGCNVILKTSPGLSAGEEMLRIWPNPAYGSDVHISVPADGKVAVYDVQGRTVAEYDVKGGENNVQLPSSISSGIYLCRYVDAGGKEEPQVVRVVYER